MNLKVTLVSFWVDDWYGSCTYSEGLNLPGEGWDVHALGSGPVQLGPRGSHPLLVTIDLLQVIDPFFREVNVLQGGCDVLLQVLIASIDIVHFTLSWGFP